MIDLHQIISKKEALSKPPIERWKVIGQLDDTSAIDVICTPFSYSISDTATVQDFVNALKDSDYVNVALFPNYEPDVKVYFRKKDGFIMAGRLHVREGVISSPEGPLIKIDAKAAAKLLKKTKCGDITNP